MNGRDIEAHGIESGVALEALETRALPRLRRYWRPLLCLVLALPLAAYAVLCSFDWFGQPFPGFLLMQNGVVPTVGGADWPADKPALFHSQVVAVDSQPVSDSSSVYAVVARQPAGTPFTYELRGASGTFRRTVESRSFSVTDYLTTYGVLLFFGLIALASGIVVGFLQPERQAARVYLLQAMITGLYACTAVFLHRPGFPVLGRLCLVLECLFAASWMHFSLVFPVERQLVGWRRALLVGPWLISGSLAVWMLGVFFSAPPDATPLHVAYVFNALALAAFIGSLVLGYRNSHDPLPRQRVKAILVGAMVCLPWPLLVFVENALGSRSIPVQFALVLTPFGYASLGYAIVQHDLFDIDRIVRRSFAYVLVSLIVLAAYALLLQLSARLAPALGAQGQTFIGMAFVLVLALSLDPLRRALQRLVDRAFGRGQLDYRGTIRELSSVLATLLDRQEIVTQVTRVVTDAMQLESTSVCLIDEDGSGTVYCRRMDSGIERWSEPNAVAVLTRAALAHPTYLDPTRLVEALADSESQREARRVVERLNPRLLVPLVVQNRGIGLLLFGPKQSGQVLDLEAVDLLRTLADQTAIAVQNARSHEALEALNRDLDAQVRRRTAELRQAYDDLKSAQGQLVQSEKMASLGQLVAGVAHELNNPASFVYGGLENLEESLGALAQVIEAYEGLPIADPAQRQLIEEVRQRTRLDDVRRDTPELLRISSEGLERIKKIIDDLRVFARADSGERTAAKVVDGIDSSLRLLGHRLTTAGIHLTCVYEDVPSIDANVAQLNQVWMNLLTNAIDAVAGRPMPEIEVRVRQVRGASGETADRSAVSPWVEVRVRDNGVGIAAESLPKLFDPFFTTKPIGQGTGLGLSIAYGAVRAHAGTLSIESQPGEGTAAIVRLPVSDTR